MKKMTHPIINEYRIACDDEFGISYYHTKEMFEKSTYIEEAHLYDESQFGTLGAVTQMISVKSLNRNNAETFTIYEGLLLDGIQIYRILKDIKELFETNTIEEFLDIMEMLSGSYQSSEMQTITSNKLNIMERMEEEFAQLKKSI